MNTEFFVAVPEAGPPGVYISGTFSRTEAGSLAKARQVSTIPFAIAKATLDLAQTRADPVAWDELKREFRLSR